MRELIASYKRPELRTEVDRALRSIVKEQARREGMEHLPTV